ncbi:hypothetical protein Q1695_015744 [Nippostrongylus brasiliensis]|nr:hypothetical protein Q1695_015744 [Nippostrongylus brasiliensis]
MKTIVNHNNTDWYGSLVASQLLTHVDLMASKENDKNEKPTNKEASKENDTQEHDMEEKPTNQEAAQKLTTSKENASKENDKEEKATNQGATKTVNTSKEHASKEFDKDEKAMNNQGAEKKANTSKESASKENDKNDKPSKEAGAGAQKLSTSKEKTTGTPTKGPNQKDNRKLKRKMEIARWTVLAVIVLLFILLCAFLIIYYRSTNPDERTARIPLPLVGDYATETTTTPRSPVDECSQTCARKDLWDPTPPLVVISLDGYSYQFLKRDIHSQFKRVAKCGVTAKVYPSFPSLTFPNHVTISNGFTPGHHGIGECYLLVTTKSKTDASEFLEFLAFHCNKKLVMDAVHSVDSKSVLSVSNTIYAKQVADQPLYLGKYSAEEHYRVEPIWSVYKRETGGSAAAFSFIGSQHNTTYYLQPDHMVKYQGRHRIDDTLKQILEWLRMDKTQRPGLIMAYTAEPDRTGHTTLGNQMNATLHYIDDRVGAFLDVLSDEGFLPCINLAFVADHGLAPIYEHTPLEDLINLDEVFVNLGAQALLFLKNNSQNLDSYLKKLSCKSDDMVRIFTHKVIPVRYQYSNNQRIGDIVLLGKHGSVVVGHSSNIHYDKHGTHGYDFIEPSMSCIFFARGPSFKQNVVLPPFQNIEYMNLWTKLLKLSIQESDGDPWFMDLALVNHTTPPKYYDKIKPCSVSSKQYSVCGNCSKQEKEELKKVLSCGESLLSSMISFGSDWSGSFCIVQSCKEIGIKQMDQKKSKVFAVAVTEMVDGQKPPLTKSCTFHLANNAKPCAKRKSAKEIGYYSIAVSPGNVLPNEYDHLVPLKKEFISNFLQPLNNYTLEVVRRVGQVISISGVVYDDNYDGFFENRTPTLTTPTHLFRILVACKTGWSKQGLKCKDPTAMKFLAFILPHVDSDLNCLPISEYLLQHTARVKDVEKISGLHFDFLSVPFMEQVVHKLYINTELW